MYNLAKGRIRSLSARVFRDLTMKNQFDPGLTTLPETLADLTRITAEKGSVKL